METVKRKNSYTAPALEKGLDIIEILSKHEAGLSQSEIARTLGRSVSEIFRMLMVLMNRGFVSLDPQSDRYVLTTYLFELAHRIPTVRRLTVSAAPVMSSLANLIRQSSHLGILNNDKVLVIGQVESPGTNSMTVRLGANFDIWTTSSGRVILANLSKEEVDDFFNRIPLPDNMSEKTIRNDLKNIRRNGYEVRDSFIVRGVVNISAPIIDHSGRAVAALTVPYIEKYHDTITFEDSGKQLVNAAFELSRSLGGGEFLPDDSKLD